MTLYWIALIAILNQIAFSGSRVVVTLFALELGASEAMVGLIIALYSVCAVLLSIVIGRYADRVPARTPMLASCAAMIVMLLLPTVFPSVLTLCVVVVVLGFLHQIFLIPLEAVVGRIDGMENRARNYAVITMSWSIANFLGPIAAGLAIDGLGYKYAFHVLATVTVAPMLMLWFMKRLLPHTPVHAAATHAQGSVLELWRNPSLRVPIIAGAIVGSAKDLFQFYMPVYGHGIGLSASAIGTILGMAAAAGFVVRAGVPLLIKRWAEAQLLVAAVFVAMIAFLLMPLFTNPYALAAVAFLLGLGVGSSEPMLLSLFYTLTGGKRIAEVIGLHKTVRNTMQISVPILFGAVGTTFGYLAVFLPNAALLAVAGILMRRALGTGGRANKP